MRLQSPHLDGTVTGARGDNVFYVWMRVETEHRALVCLQIRHRLSVEAQVEDLYHPILERKYDAA